MSSPTAGAEDHTSSSVSKLARLNRGSLLVAGFAIAVPCAVTLWTSGAEPWQRGLLLGATAVVAGQRTRWLLSLARQGRAVTPHPVDGVLTVLLATAAWAYAVTLGLVSVIWALLPGGALSAITVGQPHVRGRLGVATVGAAGATVGMVLMGVVLGQSLATLAGPAGVGLLVIAAVVGLEFLHVWSSELMVRLEDARQTAANLAVAEERLRFASDLHDTQGHYLEVIALKGDMIGRLIDRDARRARGEAAAIGRLARQALGETRGLVLGYRRTSLPREIANAAQMLRAVSMDVQVVGDPGAVPHELQPLFGAVVREGATNVLRHSTATEFECVVDVDGGEVVLRLVNDKPSVANGATNGSGLAGMRERFAAVGGEVATEVRDGRFILSARAPILGNGMVHQ